MSTNGKSAYGGIGKAVQEEMPLAHEKEDLDILEIMRRHTNRSTGKSTGPVLRSLNPKNGQIVETFPNQISWEQVREKVTYMDVVEETMSP